MPEKKKPTAILLTRLTAGSCFVAGQFALSETFDLVAIVIEDRQYGQRQLLVRKIRRLWKLDGVLGVSKLLFSLPYLYWHDTKMVRHEEKLLLDGEKPTFPADVNLHSFSSLNDIECGKFLSANCPDFIVVLGTRILKRATYGNSSVATINVHTGITPEYRGSKSEFWALFNDEPEKIGVTVHMIDDGIDTGKVLGRRKIHVESKDDEITLRVKNLKESVSLVEAVIRDWWQGDHTVINTAGSRSDFYSTPTAWQYMKLHRSLRKRRRAK